MCLIIYLKTVAEFLQDCIDPRNLSFELENRILKCTGRSSPPAEIRSWQQTLPRVADILITLKEVENVHICCEQFLSTSGSRIDLMILGRSAKDNLFAVLIELKGWTKVWWGTNVEESILVTPNFTPDRDSHPVKQVTNYERLLSAYCSSNEIAIDTSSYAFLPNMRLANDLSNPLYMGSYKDVIDSYKIYTGNESAHLAELLASQITAGVSREELLWLDKLDHPSISEADYHKRYRDRPFDLWSASQSNAMETIKKAVAKISYIRPTVLLINGGPGSGKSLLAVELLKNLVTTGHGSAVKLVIPGPELRERIKNIYPEWQHYIGGSSFEHVKQPIAIVDEGHKANANGHKSITFFKKIMEKSKLIIVFHDDDQVINKRSINSLEIMNEALCSNFDFIKLDLQEHFRNGGNSSYIQWLKKWIKNIDNSQEFFINNHNYRFEVLEDEREFVESYVADYERFDVRMASFWVWPWITDQLDSEGMPIPTVSWGGRKFTWNPNQRWLGKLQNNGIKANSKLKNLALGKNFLEDKKGWQYIAYFNTVQGT